MALPLVPIGLGALNLASGAYSYVNRRKRGQGNAQALTGAALETAAGFAIPGGAFGKGALGVGGRAVASMAASGTAGAAVDFAAQKRLPSARPPAGLLPPAPNPGQNLGRVIPAPSTTGELPNNWRTRGLQARVALSNLGERVGKGLQQAAKPMDDLFYRQSTQGGLGASIGNAVGKLPPRVRAGALVGSAVLGTGLVGANLFRQYQNRPKPPIPGLPPGVSWDVLEAKGDSRSIAAGRQKLEGYIDQRIAQTGSGPGLDLSHPEFQRRPEARRQLERIIESRFEGQREANRFMEKTDGVRVLANNLSERDRTRLADMAYAASQPPEFESSGKRSRDPRGVGRSSNAGVRSNSSLRSTDNGVGAARIRADADVQSQRAQSSSAIQQARLKADADIQTQQSQSSAIRYQARLRAQADVLGKQIQGATARYQADQNLKGVGVRAQADVQRTQIQGSTARYQADQNLRGVGIRAQADVLGKQIQGSTARYQADQNLRGVGIRAQADVQRTQIQSATAQYQADQKLRGVETQSKYDYQAKSEASQNQLAGVKSRAFASIAAAQANAASKIHAEALKRRDPELDSISTVEEYEDYKRRKKLQRAKADLSF